jgi:hypothetical protein
MDLIIVLAFIFIGIMALNITLCNIRIDWACACDTSYVFQKTISWVIIWVISLATFVYMILYHTETMGIILENFFLFMTMKIFYEQANGGLSC